MKVFISQPMRGKTEKQIREERKQIIDRFDKEKYEILDTIFTEEAPEGSDAGIYYLAKSIEELAKADIVVFVTGWHKARGCKIEHNVASAYEKIIIYMDLEETHEKMD